jgi:ABC-2 type transport system permease protein
MIRLIRAELLKLGTIRLTYGLLAVAAALTALFATLEASRAGNADTGVAPLSTASGLSTVTTVTGFAMLFAAVLGAIVTSGEFRHASATLTYQATPRRDRVLIAKVLVSAAGGAVFGLVAGVIATGIGLAFLAGDHAHVPLSTATLLGHVGGAVCGAAALAALGAGLGSLVRSQLATVIGILVWGIVIESIIGGLFTSIAPTCPTRMPRPSQESSSATPRSAPRTQSRVPPDRCRSSPRSLCSPPSPPPCPSSRPAPPSSTTSPDHQPSPTNNPHTEDPHEPRADRHPGPRRDHRQDFSRRPLDHRPPAASRGPDRHPDLRHQGPPQAQVPLIADQGR